MRSDQGEFVHKQIGWNRAAGSISHTQSASVLTPT